MEYIKMMDDLIRKSLEIKNNYIEEKKVTKEEMIAKAKEKIEKYFGEVLKKFPFKSDNVNLSHVGIEIFIRKNDITNSLVDDKLSSNGTIKEFIIVKFNYKYFTVNNEFVGKYWNRNHLFSLEEKNILEIAENFDAIKSAIEKSIMDRTNKILNENAKSIENEEKKLKVLENFLENN